VTWLLMRSTASASRKSTPLLASTCDLAANEIHRLGIAKVHTAARVHL
jgi:hypothetical protein